MTTLASNAAPQALPARAARASLGAQLVIGALVLAFAAVFFRWILRQFGTGGWSYHHFEDWGHAYIVPLISGFYVWQRRDEIVRAGIEPFWPGLGVMLMGIVTYVYFLTGYPNHMFQGFAMILALAGLSMLLLGPRVFPIMVFPLAYLGFAVTISEAIMLKITWGLKLLASQGAWALLNLIQVDTDINGNILNVYHGGEVTPLNVADACAGMRMVVAFIALAVAVAFLSCRLWWQRIAVCLLAIPVALLMNIVRVAVLGVATLFDADLAVGGAHTFIGTLLLIPAFFLFMGCVWLLKALGNQLAAPAPGATA
ncbi:MAG: exosortase/archaeosortase family protein [Planctomycetota bacterium]|nr:exosortase/archaeosortase family protein [Planctomycetota bacterium]